MLIFIIIHKFGCYQILVEHTVRSILSEQRRYTCLQDLKPVNRVQSKKTHLLSFYVIFQTASNGLQLLFCAQSLLLPLLVTAYRAKASSIANGSLSWLLHLVVNLSTSGVKTQAAWYTCGGFFLIRSTEIGRPTLNPDHLRWQEPP